MLLKAYPKQKYIMDKHLCTKQGIIMALIIAGLLITGHSFAQTTDEEVANPTGETEGTHHKRKLPEAVYPKVVGYLSFIIPTATLQDNKVTTNFSSATSIGFPTGVNVFYSSKFGFSYEITPTIKTTNGNSKMSNLLFDPGPMFRFKHGFTIIPRLAFETSGRYGVTPVFNEVYLRTKAVNYFVALSLPMRTGADNGVQASGSLGLNVQFGFIFN